MKAVVTTLFEGDYVLGVGALVNSLYAHGFRGVVYAGYRGTLTDWSAVATQCQGYREMCPAEGLTIRFVPVSPGWHLANLKPSFMIDVIDHWEPDYGSIYYLDPDIVVTCRWSFFEEWVGYGISLCEEITFFPMGPTHPTRQAWVHWLASQGIECRTVRGGYFNSGFVGVKSPFRAFLETWHHLHATAERAGHDMKRFHWLDNTELFRGMDQDLLNCTTMVSDHLISSTGPDGMGFSATGFVMEHATSQPKPWRKRYVRSALQGAPPSRAEKAWIRHTSSPIKVLRPDRKRRMQSAMRIGSAIGRFMRRT